MPPLCQSIGKPLHGTLCSSLLIDHLSMSIACRACCPNIHYSFPGTVPATDALFHDTYRRCACLHYDRSRLSIGGSSRITRILFASNTRLNACAKNSNDYQRPKASGTSVKNRIWYTLIRKRLRIKGFMRFVGVLA